MQPARDLAAWSTCRRRSGPAARRTCAGVDLEVDAVQHLDAVVRGADALQLEQRLDVARPRPCRLVGAHAHLRPEVGLDDGGVSADLGGRARGDDRPEVEHVDLVADPHDERHVVLDEQDGEPGRGQLGQQRRRSSSVSFSSRPDAGSSNRSRRGRMASARPSLDQAGLAGGQLTGADVGDVRQTEAVHQQVDLVVEGELVARRPAAGGRRQDARPSLGGSRPPTSTFSRAVIDPKTSRRWNVRADATPGAAVGAERRRSSTPSKRTRPADGREHAGDQVERRGLARRRSGRSAR